MAIDTNTPTFVERDPAVIMAESKAKLEELLGRELQPAQVEQLILNFVVFRETLLVNRFNAGMRQMLYQFSTAPILDYIAGLVAVERLPAASAGCTVRFTLVAGHGSVLIPEGTRVSSSDGVAIFRTVDDAVIAPTTMTIELAVLADVAGKVGNGYAIGTINKILDPLAFVSTVENIDVTGGGSDVESDEQLRERIKLAPSQYSSAGSRSSYKFYAKSANAMITDVSVSSPVPGTVLIVPLTEVDETPAQVITDVYDVCSAENVRPLTDTVIVSAPEREDYAITVDVVLYDGAVCCANPIFDRERHIVSLDGGCGVKHGAQLNAVLVGPDGAFSCAYCDGLPQVRALDAQARGADPFHLRWTERAVERLSAENGVARVRHSASGRILDVPESYLYDDGGRLCCADFPADRLEIAPGDLLSLVDETPLGYIVKKDGVSGLYGGRVRAL